LHYYEAMRVRVLVRLPGDTQRHESMVEKVVLTGLLLTTVGTAAAAAGLYVTVSARDYLDGEITMGRLQVPGRGEHLASWLGTVLSHPAPMEAPPASRRRWFAPRPGRRSCTPLLSEQLNLVIADVTRRHDISHDLLRAVIETESGNSPCVVSHRGATGLMQLMPATARTFGVADPTDPARNVEAGARYLKSLLARYDNNVTLALAAYNAGPGEVDRFGGIPPHQETRRYVARVIRKLAQATAPE
jgi:hypothetical protein